MDCGAPSSRKRRNILITISIFLWLSTFFFINGIMVEYWYYPAEENTYSQHDCNVKSCNISVFTMENDFFMNVRLVIEYNGYEKNANISNKDYIKNYCNETTTIVCYSYDNDITSLTITKDDLDVSNIGMIVFLMVIIVNVVGLVFCCGPIVLFPACWFLYEI